MSEYSHLKASWGTELDVPADDFIKAASHWSNIGECLLDNHPFKFSKVELAEGSVEGVQPCTRIMYLDKSAMSKEVADASPDTFHETLIVTDPIARTMVYKVEGEPMGMRNYYGFKEVEVLGPNKCRATITVRFDFPAELPTEQLMESLIAVYKGVILGIGEKLKNG